MRRLLLTCIVMMAAVTASAQAKVVINVVTPDSTRTLIVPKDAIVEFERYYEPKDFEIVDLGLSIKWASVNYSNSRGVKYLEWKDSEHDYVAADWGERYGEPWRLPTQEDYQLLKDSCTWTKVDGGYEVTTNLTDDVLFLPFTASRTAEQQEDDAKFGWYWTSNVDEANPSFNGMAFQFHYDELDGISADFRALNQFSELAVRPVYGELKSRVKPFVQNAAAQDYRSAIIQISVENVESGDVMECGVYYSTNKESLPTNQKSAGSSAKKVAAILNSSMTADVQLDKLYSGYTYYVCAFVTTEKGTTYSEYKQFTVKPMTVSFASTTPKSVGETNATVSLNLQGYPTDLISSYGVTVTGGSLNAKEYLGTATLNSVVADVEITDLVALTEYTCTPFAIFDGNRILGNTSLTFTTSDTRRVNEKFPIPEKGVDMGLPSGLLWAPYNLYYQAKADSVSYFFGWGDPTGTKLSAGNGSDYAGGQQILTIAGTEYDIATMQWNELDDLEPLRSDKWRLPTKADFEELFAYCTPKDHTENGVSGLLFTNKTDPSKTLFMPLPGGMSSVTLEISNVGTSGFYWTAEANLSKQAYWLRLQKAINDDSFELHPRGTRGCIRPVYGKINSGDQPYVPPVEEPEEDHTLDIGGYDVETEDGGPAEGAQTAYPMEAVDLGLPSGIKWAAWNVGTMEYGGDAKYYAWGETTTKSSFRDVDTYNSPVKGLQVYDLPDSLDVAEQLWGIGGGCWTMPGLEHYQELFKEDPNNPGTLLYVTAEWVSYDESHKHAGMKVTSRTTGTYVDGEFVGNSIFFPAYGDKTTNVSGEDKRGFYWTKTGSGIAGKRTTHAECFEFGQDPSEPDGMFHKSYSLERFDGCMVRPIWFVPVTGLKANGSTNLTVKVEEEFTLDATLQPSNATKTGIDFKIGDTTILRRAGSKYVALKEGTTTVVLEAADHKTGTHALTYTITVTQ